MSSDAKFVESSILETLIPQASDLDIEDILSSAEDIDVGALISSIPQRELLFFDESLPVYSVLKSTSADEASLKNQLSRITIALEAHAVNSPSNEKERQAPGNQARDVIWTGKVDVTEDPVTVVLGSAEHGQTVLLVWKTIVMLGRPRVRLQAPAVLFKVSASLQPALPKNEEVIDPYLPSGVPLPSNILQPLGMDAALKTALPQLSRLNLGRKSTKTSAAPREILPIKVVARRACRAVPALSSRIRMQKAAVQHDTPTMIGALEIDVPPFSQYPLTITSVAVTIPQGTVQEISSGKIPAFPMTLHAKDQVISLYSLTQDAQAAAQGQHVQTLEILINVSIAVGEDCNPRVQVHFKANVDFAGAAGSRANPIAQRGSKPVDTATVKPDDQLRGQDSDTTSIAERLGIIIKFTAKGEVYIGEAFHWEVFVMNQSGRQRRLGLSLLYKRMTPGEKRVTSRPTSMTEDRLSKAESLAEAYTDDNVLYTSIKSQNRDATQLICLNTDVKIGPLNPGSCFSTEMEFLPLATGLLQIYAIRLTDYTTNEAVDIRDLPDILAMDRKQMR